MIEDELLKIGFKAGRSDALRRIYEKYRDSLLTLAMALVNDASAAEDVVHDVFVSFAQSGAKFRLRGNLRSYLATCIINRARDRIRAAKRQPLSLNEQVTLESDFDRPDQRILSDEQSQQVAEALFGLPEEQREVIVLHLSAEMRFRQIAAVQDVPLSTVRGRYRHGLEKLRSILDGRLEK